MNEQLVFSIIFRAVFCIIPATMASKRGRSSGGWYAASFFTVPLICIIILCFLNEKYVYFCPKCGHIEHAEANRNLKCTACSDLPVLFFTGVKVAEYNKFSESIQSNLQEEWKTLAIDNPTGLIVKVEPETPKEYKWQCSACRHTLTGWYKTCPDCGSIDTIVKMEQPVAVETQAESYCISCGAQLDADSAFCPQCGTKVE